MLRLVFMGTPDLAATVLRRVLEEAREKVDGEVVAVYSQPDRPAGRGMELKAPPVKTLALEYGVPVFQPLDFRGNIDVEMLRALDPDYLLVAAYGLILPQRVLDIPSRMALNAHTSLLPKYRGAAPIQRAIMNGDTETGVSIMRMDAGLDTGPVVLRKALPITAADTAGTLHGKLADLAGELLLAALAGLEKGVLEPLPQNEAEASWAAKLDKRDGALDFSLDARRVDAIARGVFPWPGAFATLEREGEKPLRVVFASGAPLTGDGIYGGSNAGTGNSACGAHGNGDAGPGSILGLVDGRIAVRCGCGVYGLSSLKPAGKSVMDAAAFANGYLKGRKNARFTNDSKD